MPQSATLRVLGERFSVVDDAGRKSGSGLEPARPLRWLMPNPDLSDDAGAMQMQRFVLAIGAFFLLVYLLYDLRLANGPFSGAMVSHWVAVGVTLLFFVATWTAGFRRHWKPGNLFFGVLLVSIFILISAQTHEGDSRFCAVLLFPAATAAFLNWGWRWQAAMGAACIVLYAIAQICVPIPGAASYYRWFGLIAAVALAECTALFIAIYREGLRAQVGQLVAAAAFRDSQMSTMAHDIRSPVAAIAGFVDLLEDKELSADDRKVVLERLGATAWSMDLTVSNVLDLYQIQGGQIACAPMRLSPNRVVADAAARCADQAARKGLTLIADYGEVPTGNFDPRHLERIARNLLCYSISRLTAGEIRLTTTARGGGIAVEVRDDGAAPAPEEIADILTGGDAPGIRASSAMLGLFVARALARNAGGAVKLAPQAAGLKLVAEVPSAAPETKPAAS